ncbi:hypothetical protein C8R44DRAFT_726041 [Mycena epipterygia]|nr:hypothetical protein C8R44DRAFT_726041 [Mycena epipterygia]
MCRGIGVYAALGATAWKRSSTHYSSARERLHWISSEKFSLWQMQAREPRTRAISPLERNERPKRLDIPEGHSLSGCETCLQSFRDLRWGADVNFSNARGIGATKCWSQLVSGPCRDGDRIQADNHVEISKEVNSSRVGGSLSSRANCVRTRPPDFALAGNAFIFEYFNAGLFPGCDLTYTVFTTGYLLLQLQKSAGLDIRNLHKDRHTRNNREKLKRTSCNIPVNAAILRIEKFCERRAVVWL